MLFFKKLISKFKNIKLIDKRQLYQYWEQEHLKKLLNKYDVDCIFDVGANYGQYSKMLRDKVGYKGLIISFEPIPDAVAHLKKISSDDPKWIVVGEALSTENGEQVFNVMESSQFSSLSSPRHDEVTLFKKQNVVHDSISVKTETLESAFYSLQRKYNFAKPFLKLDTQGYDVEIISASKNVVSNFVGLQSELSFKGIYDHSISFKESLAVYEGLGFTLSAFVPNNAGHFPLLVETDCIMINNQYI